MVYLQSSEGSLQVRDTHMAPSVLLSLLKDNPITELNKNKRRKPGLNWFSFKCKEIPHLHIAFTSNLHFIKEC